MVAEHDRFAATLQAVGGFTATASLPLFGNAFTRAFTEAVVSLVPPAASTNVLPLFTSRRLPHRALGSTRK